MKGKCFYFPLCPLFLDKATINSYLEENEKIIEVYQPLKDLFLKLLEISNHSKENLSTRPANRVDKKISSKRREYFLQIIRKIPLELSCK